MSTPSPNATDSKPLLQSKTAWFNAVAGLITLLLQSADAGTLPAQLAPYSVWIILIGNVILRLITTQPVSLTGTGTSTGAIAFIACCLVTATACAEPPRAVIAGPSRVEPGEFLTLSADVEATHYVWRVKPDAPGKRRFEIAADGKSVRLATLPGTQWEVTLIVSNADGPDAATHLVEVSGCGNGPQPNPVPPQPNPVPPSPQPIPPNPQPEPPVPSPAGLGLRALVAKFAADLRIDNKATVCRSIADSLDGVAAQVAAKTLSGQAAIRDATKAALAVFISNNPSAWQTFSAKYSAAVAALFVAGRIQTDEDWANVLRETAAGFRDVR